MSGASKPALEATIETLLPDLAHAMDGKRRLDEARKSHDKARDKLRKAVRYFEENYNNRPFSPPMI